MKVYVYKSTEPWGGGTLIVSEDMTEKEMIKNCGPVDFSSPTGPFELSEENMKLLDTIVLRSRYTINDKIYWDNTWVE